MDYFLKIIFISIFLFFKSKEEIINNPVKISDTSNPIVIQKDSKYCVFTSKLNIIINKETGLIESTNSIAEYNRPYVLCIDESNNYFLYAKYKYYSIIPPSTFSTISLSISSSNLPSSSIYVGYIREKEYAGKNITDFSVEGCRCKIYKDDIIIYGKNDEKIFFASIQNKKALGKIEISNDLEDQMSCKMIISAEYLCSLVYNQKVYLYAFVLATKTHLTHDNCIIKLINSVQIDKMETHTQVELYDTEINNKKILCSKNINNLNIECVYVSCEIIEKSIFN